MAIATKEEILKQLDSIDLKELLDRMENYTRGRFYNKSDKTREGIDYLDFCYNVLIKACDGIRNWDMDKVTFENFVFGCLKSDLYNFFRKLKNKKRNSSPPEEDAKDPEVYLIEINEYTDLSDFASDDEPPDIDFKDISKDAIYTLKKQGADAREIGVFECWLASYYKPTEIAELCGCDVKEVYNAIKRLSRKNS